MSTNHTIRPTDDDARQLARALIREAPSASLATLSRDGWPLATLTSVGVDVDGTPLILVSRLSGHTVNLLHEARVSLLFARGGKGDPLAHPRISLMGRARVLARETDEGARFRRRFLARQPKAALYVDFADFLFVRVEPESASLNGGFGKAYELGRDDLLTPTEGAESLLAAEHEILAHMNGDHGAAVGLYATKLAGREPGAWRMIGIDPEGFEVAQGGEIARIGFSARVTTPDDARRALVALVKAARTG